MKTCIYPFVLVLSLIVAFSSCKKDILSGEEMLEEKEQDIINKMNDAVPPELISLLESHFDEASLQEGYPEYLDELNLAVDSFLVAVEDNMSSEEYQDIVLNTLVSLEQGHKSTAFEDQGLGYAKGVEVNVGVSGSVGAGIVAGLQACGGGGVKTVYDFVNMDREIYYTLFCSAGVNLGVGVSAALSAEAGFSGINELITGIPYYGGAMVPEKFDGASIAKNHSLGVDLEFLLGFDVSVSIGSSQEAVADPDAGNTYNCLDLVIPVENGTSSYSFAVSGSISAGIGAEIILAYRNENIVSYSTAASRTYRHFADDRSLAGFRMAAEILRTGPVPGIASNMVATDYVASSLAIAYGFQEMSSTTGSLATIGTLPVENITGNSCISGGTIPYDGGYQVTSRGVCWNTGGNPTLADAHTSEGTGTGSYSSQLSGLTPATTYHVRAYAINAAGTSYGEEQVFTTSSGGSTSDYVAGYSASSISVDGDIGASEWNNANAYNITFSRFDGYDSKSGTMYLQHDNTWVYIGVVSPVNSGWDVYLGLHFDGNNDDVLNGRASEPHTDINIQCKAPGAWSGYDRFDYLVAGAVNPTSAPAGTAKASSGSSNVAYEFKIKLSDLNLSADNTFGFHMFNYNHGVVDESYVFPEDVNWDSPAGYEDIQIE